MSNVRILIVEDEFIIAESLSASLIQLGYEVTGTAASYGEAIEQLDTTLPDLAILDINLAGKKDGIDLGAVIRERYDIPFIFLTANADAATINRAKQVEPNAYLIKPFYQNDLFVTIEVCLHNFTMQRKSQPAKSARTVLSNTIFVKQGNGHAKVRLDDIRYLESDHVYVVLHLVDDNKLLVRTTMQEITDQLPDDVFIRIHRTYMININHLDAIDPNQVTIHGRELPVGPTYKDELIARLKL